LLRCADRYYCHKTIVRYKKNTWGHELIGSDKILNALIKNNDKYNNGNTGVLTREEMCLSKQTAIIWFNA